MSVLATEGSVVSAAQSMGEWPGASWTLARGLGVLMAVLLVGKSVLPVLPTRWALLGGGPRFGRRFAALRFGRGLRGARRVEGVWLPGRGVGRAGGGIRDEAEGGVGLVGLGGGGIANEGDGDDEARWALFAAGKLGASGSSSSSSSLLLLERENVGTASLGFVAAALGVPSKSPSSVNIASPSVLLPPEVLSSEYSFLLAFGGDFASLVFGSCGVFHGFQVLGGFLYARNDTETSNAATLQ